MDRSDSHSTTSHRQTDTSTLSTKVASNTATAPDATAPPPPTPPSSSRPSRASHTKKNSPSSSAPAAPRRSARISAANAGPESKADSKAADSESPTAGPSRRTRVTPPAPAAPQSAPSDRKGKKRAAREPSPEATPKAADPPAKRTKRSSPPKTPAPKAEGSSSKGKDKAKPKSKSMPKRAVPKKGAPPTGTKKGDTSARHRIDNSMDEDESRWEEASGSRGLLDDSHYDHDEDMDHSDHDDEDEDDATAFTAARGSYDRLARLADGALFDEATAAALFGGEFRAFGGLLSGQSSRWKRLKADLRSPKSAVRLAALRECSDILLVSNEDTLGPTFSVSSFATEFVAILNGKPNIDKPADGDDHDDELDEDAQLAAALAMSTGGMFPGDDQDEMEAQLLACRCLAHLMEALPGSGHNLVHLGAVPVLCSKLNEISYIELAEQTLSTMEKISAEYPGAIVREGGLAALLNFLPFFSTNVQRTAVTAAANCCRNISSEHFAMIRDVFPILRDVLTQSDQRLVEQATLAVVRTLESYRHNADHLDGLLDVPTVVAINALLMPSGGSPLISDSTYTQLLKSLTSAAKASPKVTLAFLEAGITSTVHYILTGVLPSSHEDTEQGDAPGGQSLGGGIADMAIMQNLAHRPKDQVEEALGLICELLPPIPRDGVFDPRGYTEKNLARIKKRGDRPDRPRRTSSRTAESGSASGPSTPVEGVLQEANMGALAAYNLGKKREAELQYEQRLNLLKSQPDLISKFMRALVPVLVDVYAASVSLRVRTKALTGLVKAAAFAEPDDLHLTLTSVPMSSFLGSIISSKDNPGFVLFALQLVELLATKLPEVYLTSFLREGVVYEIETLAREDLSTKAKEEATEAAKAPESSTPKPTALPSAGEVPLSLAHLFPDPNAVTTPRKSASLDLSDANIIRARVVGAKNIFAMSGDQQNEASVVLQELGVLVKRLCIPEATEGELRDTLREIAAQFSNVGQALSSFELLRSGLVDGLLEYVDIDGAVSSPARRAILYDIFSDTALSSPSPLAMLVKRLHESLGRLETLEVETAFNGLPGASAASSLTRSLRIRLQAEEGDDIPKQMSALSVTIQAIAPVQALIDYLRPRIADPNYLSGSQSLQSMFAAYAASRGGGGGPSSRLLAALAAGGLGSGGVLAEPTPAAAATASAAATTEAKAEGKTSKPERRRSARLSGRLTDPDTTEAGPSTSAADASIVPHIPVGMDIDDEYSEDEYDAEVFEEEMEEELSRPPAEKVVNMSMAPDGSRVEAKTPDGTRIATPNQAAAESGATGASDTPTRTGSYAGAVKTAPTDWHLEFSINGQVLSPEDTVYGAVHRHSKASTTGTANMFSLPVVFKFRKADGPAPTKAAADAPSPASTVSILPPVLDPSQPVSKILRLLRVVHGLCVDGRDATGRADAPDENLFVNHKLTAKLTRQLEETMILASNCLPEWAVELPKHFAFLFPFETRYNFLRSTSFGYGRLIAHWQASQPRNTNSSRRDDGLSNLGRLVRQKVRISRSQLLESCVKVLELYGTSNGVLEVEYFEEIGTGLGPTLEFYALASKEFTRRALHLWRDEDTSEAGGYVWHPHGLFPAPLKGDEPPKEGSSSFKTLGLFVGRALLDSRIIDLNFNKVFIKQVLGKSAQKSIATLKLVDAPLARSIERLQSYLDTRKEIDAMASLPASSRRSKLAALTISGAKLHDLSLDFTLPGYDIELKPGGRMIDVDDTNLEEYIELVLDKTLGSGIARQVKEFQEGFSMIFPVQDLQIFSPEELCLLCGNADEDWSRETLEQAIKADHGYNADSRVVRDLVNVMSSYSTEERRAFLQFMTGAPKLPLGGFKGLNPPFTVVRKPHEPPFKADDYLPSVMTCATYLKLPDYSSKAVLAAQLQRSMRDGQGSFNLS